VRKRVPKARLKVFYGFDIFDRFHPDGTPQAGWKREMLAKMEKMKKLGVDYVGRIGQDILADEQQHARVWAYPYQYQNATETSCITAMEAMAAGMYAVTTFSGALPETISGAGCVIVGSNAAFPVEAFVDEIVRGLTDKGKWEHMSRAARDRALDLTWESLIDQWDERLAARVGSLV
jgi:glycosyltransferase involved in cell wall biosynthesis